ncbi:hypothetical protein EYF80_024667 [Liparis tanakae]|uniref:Uncharacterized protein n=1 Tax=Liparis tanakae TaxID=230148 RepID=A0A4Z2HH19_9TELE|nr:hypothetical protein EYF80_024667 [Liparis tanakae]
MLAQEVRGIQNHLITPPSSLLCPNLPLALSACRRGSCEVTRLNQPEEMPSKLSMGHCMFTKQQHVLSKMQDAQ